MEPVSQHYLILAETQRQAEECKSYLRTKKKASGIPQLEAADMGKLEAG